jgi:hypothetical protein
MSSSRSFCIGVVQDFTDYFEGITADRRANPAR